jgi:hypothetical protein
LNACDCRACRDLASEYANDPVLLEFYRVNLLKRGWAGSRTPAEKVYIQAHTVSSAQDTACAVGGSVSP